MDSPPAGEGSLSLEDIMQSITMLSSESGLDSQSRKLDTLFDLYGRCGSSIELKYIIRCLHPSGLRIGLSSKSMEASLLEYLRFRKIDDPAIIRDFEQNLFGYRISATSDSPLVLNVPLKPMVGRPAKTADEAFKTLIKKTDPDKSDLIVEVKYDGERTQIHYENGIINLYSRNFDL